MPRTIVIPRRIDLDGIREYLDQNDLNSDALLDGLLLDNRGHEWIEPIGLVAVCASVRHLRAGCVAECQVNFAHPEQASYMQRMDLFREIGVEVPEEFRRWESEGRFVELTPIERYEDVDTVASRIIESFPDDRELRIFAHYTLTELLNNAFQHAQSATVPVVCAQRWSARGVGQVAIADCGVGLKWSLEKNPIFRPIASHQEAITIALQPWTTGNVRPPEGQPRYLHNRGLGLYMVSRLAEAVGGQMVLISGDAYLYSAPSGELRTQVRGWSGTLVAVQFPLRLPAPWDQLRRSVLPAKRGR
jgi:hypothetical protein